MILVLLFVFYRVYFCHVSACGRCMRLLWMSALKIFFVVGDIILHQSQRSKVLLINLYETGIVDSVAQYILEYSAKQHVTNCRPGLQLVLVLHIKPLLALVQLIVVTSGRDCPKDCQAVFCNQVR